MELNKFEILLADLIPVFVAIASIGLHEIHEILSISALSISAIYSAYKLKSDFFTKNKNKNGSK